MVNSSGKRRNSTNVLLISGAWPVLIDEFVEYARPRIAEKQTTV